MNLCFRNNFFGSYKNLVFNSFEWKAITGSVKMKVHFVKYFFLNGFFSHESRYIGDQTLQNHSPVHKQLEMRAPIHVLNLKREMKILCCLKINMIYLILKKQGIFHFAVLEVWLFAKEGFTVSCFVEHTNMTTIRKRIY